MPSMKHRQSLKHRTLHHVKHAVVPHKANRFQPHLVRRWGLVAVLSAVIILQFVANLPIFTPADDVVLGAETGLSDTELLNASNAVRKANSVPSLALNDKL